MVSSKPQTLKQAMSVCQNITAITWIDIHGPQGIKPNFCGLLFSSATICYEVCGYYDIWIYVNCFSQWITMKFGRDIHVVTRIKDQWIQDLL